MDRLKISKDLIREKDDEYYNTIRTNLQLLGKSFKTILFTSYEKGNGKSTVSFNTARSLAKLGMKVLFIDADIRGSVFASKVMVENNSPLKGLSNYLSGINKFDEVVYNSNIPNLYLILAGVYAPSPTELLQNKLFEKMLLRSREIFDYIIFDTPPLGRVIDASIIAKNCDGYVLVVQANSTRRSSVKKMLTQLDKTNCKFMGTVLTSSNVLNQEYGEYGRY